MWFPIAETFDSQQYEDLQGEFEENLANIWRELLKVERINRHDNFFALGGHSLLVVQLLTKLRLIGLDTTVQKVFDAPDLATLASILTRFNAMTIPLNLITKDRTEITPEMLPLITLSQADIDTITAQVPSGVANIQDIYALTPLQNGMLYHHLMTKEGDPYLIANQMRFTDRTSLERYTNAMNQVIERHDILRTAIFWDGITESAQVVVRQVSSFLAEICIGETDELTIEHMNKQINPSHYRFDLTRAPLIRLFSAETSEGSWVAVQLMHQIISGPSSLEDSHSLMWDEIHAIMVGKIEMLKTVTPFRYFACQTRLGTTTAEHTRFFTEMLGDIDEPTLPFGLSDVNRDKSEINERYLALPQTLSDQLRMHAQNLQVCLASICHLAWAQVLAKTSGRDSVVFGTVLLGRLQSGESNTSIIGPMINTLPLRLDIVDKNVEIAVRQTHSQLSALLSHEHAPLILAKRCSGVATDLPLFTAILNYRHNQKIEEIDTSPPGVYFLSSEGQTNYPLTLSLDDDDNSLCLTVQVVSPCSSERICAYMQQALQSLVHTLIYRPQPPIRQLEVMPPEERTLLLHNWNQTEITHLPVCCLHQLFETHVKLNGESVAVEYEGNILSYAELNLQANQLAHYLISRGVKPDDRIALCVERSTTMIVAILGILKAGCAYVPLDPVYASQRLTNVLLDADPKFLLADSTGRKALGNHHVPEIHLDEPSPTDLSIDNPDVIELGVTVTHLAYIIYTSGSTGTPKGVMVEHQHVVRYFTATHDTLEFKKEYKWCLFHSISFDFSIEEIWGALLYGSQLFIAPHSIIGSAIEFYAWICSKGINILGQTPLAFKNLLLVDNLSSRRDQILYVILGGEALDATILTDWYRKYDNGITMLLNTYGPTETTIDATVWICDGEVSNHVISPIGRPLSNKRIYLMNSIGDLVPLGVVGEIYISGEGIARGYLNRPELTADRFLPDPFNNDPAARMYRTGDLARYLPDGKSLLHQHMTDSPTFMC